MGLNKSLIPTPPRLPIRDIISLVVTGLVVIGFICDILIDGYDIPAPLWGAFMLILGYFFADKLKKNGKTP